MHCTGAYIHWNVWHYIFFVLTIGPPPAPTNLTATENGLGSLNISWSLAFIEGVPVNFTLTAISPSDELIVMSGIRDQHYIFTADHHKCDSYGYSVQAENILGLSDNSAVLIATLPSTPDFSQAEDLLDYYLSKDSNGFILIIALIVSTSNVGKLSLKFAFLFPFRMSIYAQNIQ